jgi:hypothetical protein
MGRFDPIRVSGMIFNSVDPVYLEYDPHAFAQGLLSIPESDSDPVVLTGMALSLHCTWSGVVVAELAFAEVIRADLVCQLYACLTDVQDLDDVPGLIKGLDGLEALMGRIENRVGRSTWVSLAYE